MKKGECRMSKNEDGNVGYSFGDAQGARLFRTTWRTRTESQKGLDSKHLRAEWDVWPPKGQRHSIQQEGGNDFRANGKSGMFDGQPSGCLFVGGRNRFVSRDESAAVITLRCGRKRFHVNMRGRKGKRKDETGKQDKPPCDRQ